MSPNRFKSRQERLFAEEKILQRVRELRATPEVEVQRRESLQLIEPRAERRDVRELRAAPEVEVQRREIITWEFKTASGLWLVPPYRIVRVTGCP